MDKKALMLYGAKHAVLEMMGKGSCSFAKRLDDGSWQTIDWADIADYLTEMIDNYNTETEKT